MSLLYRHSVIGGTFDFLHRGHQELITFALSHSDIVTIGVVSDKFAKKSGKNTYFTLQHRLARLNNFLHQGQKLKKYNLVVIDDVFGTTISDKTIDTIIVTKDTLEGAAQINRRRREGNLIDLKIVDVPLVFCENGEPISSTQIKRGLIDREGVSFIKSLEVPTKFVLPHDLRKKISASQGRRHVSVADLLRNLSIDPNKLIVVGDESVRQFLSNGIVPRLSVIDFFIQRERIFNKTRDLGFIKSVNVSSAVNRAGTISSDSIQNIHELLGNKETIKNVLSISGEEDLCVIPCVLLAPLDYVVVYGQRNKGLVAIDIDEKKKNDFLEILARFTRV